MTLRDGMHPKRHQISLDQMIEIATALDDARCPLIEVTHGDGLGGASINYGFSKHTEEDYLRAVVPRMTRAKISALLLPGIGTVDELRMAVDCGIHTIRVATHCTEADIARQHIQLGRELGLDLHRLIKAANNGYPRDRIPVPSPGVGGPCLTKDGYLLKYSAQGLEAQPRMSLLAREVNERIPHALLEVIENFLKGLGKPRVKVVLIGLAFKGQPETSDLRDSTALVFSERLQCLSEPEVDLFGYDAVIEPGEIEALGITACTIEAGFEEADAVLILNNHRSHPNIDIFDLHKITVGAESEILEIRYVAKSQ